MSMTWLSRMTLVGCGVMLGLGADWGWRHAALAAVSAQQGRASAPVDIPADVAHLKGVVPSQSHAMADVAYHWANLWFAAQKRNWPLAQFYFDESRSHILWTIRIRPVRRGPDGKDVDIKGIFDGIETSSLAAVKQAIEKKSSAEFASSYKTMLESCYACHKAAGKPYLRPMIPLTPTQSMINVDPNARWPE